jgi:hypothetical protein
MEANSTLDKTVKMRYDTRVYNYNLAVTAIGMPQE